ncbi:MAG: SulP family inorganic anion transporter [Limisphaerales bacterium]
MKNSEKTKTDWRRELMASVVVFLVALPLCMGIAIASGVPPALGLISGIVGGLLVGTIGGSPLQVSGPAAGLAVLVWQYVEKFGLAALGWVVLFAGIIQMASGRAKLGRWFRAVSPAVVQGMLAGIGVLIFASQFHVMVDDKPRSSGVENLLTIPVAIQKGILPIDGSVHHLAAIIGVLAIASIVLWTRFRPLVLKAVPGPLVAIVGVTALAGLLQLPIQYVTLPDNLFSGLNTPRFGDGSLFATPAFWGAVIGFALIASAETLLCATAVDRMHKGERTDYDKELFAQGIANTCCGLVGALPITGVIVRSSANVEAGAKTRFSAIFHGVWLLLLVGFVPVVLSWVPTSALAAILVYTGYKLVNPQAMRNLWKAGRPEFAIYLVTVMAIVTTDLLTGVLIGFGLALARLLYTFLHLEVLKRESVDGQVLDIALKGAATFVQLPRVAEELERIPEDVEVRFHLGALAYADHAILELVGDWQQRREGEVHIAWDELKSRKGLVTPDLPGFVSTASAGIASLENKQSPKLA